MTLDLLTKRTCYVFTLLVCWLFISGCIQPQKTGLVIVDPYANVDWENTGRFRANLHTHTTGSDGAMHPHVVVDHYHRLGYQILAIADHNAVTYPWTGFTALAPGGYWLQMVADGRIDAKEQEAREDRDPAALGMIAIQGNELSSHHHMGSFFNPHNGTTTEVDSLDALTALGGIAMLYHPGRYQKEIEWYADLYRTYPGLFGMEVFNQGDRYPGDRAIWDAVLTELMPERQVWAHSNDDMHVLSHLGRNYNVMLLSELTPEKVRAGMENGWSYFVYNPVATNRIADPLIQAIHIGHQQGTILIRKQGKGETVWISEGIELHKGDSIHLLDFLQIGSYVRAELRGEGGIVVGTQPFAILRPVRFALELPSVPGQTLYANEDHIIAKIMVRNISGEQVQGTITAQLGEQIIARERMTQEAGETTEVPLMLPINALNAGKILNVAMDLGKDYKFRTVSSHIRLDIPNPVSLTIDVPSLRYARLRLTSLLDKHELPLEFEALLDGKPHWSGKITLEPDGSSDVRIPLPLELRERKGVLDIQARWPRDIGPTDCRITAEIELGCISLISKIKVPDAAAADVFASPAITLDVQENVMPVARRERWENAGDLSVEFQWGWHGADLWIEALVQDEHHANNKQGEHIWDGDALQIAVAPRDGKPSNVAFALTDNGIVAHTYKTHGPELLEHSSFSVVRDNEKNETRYRIKLPLKRLGIPAEAGACFGLSAVVFDDDSGNGYDYWMQLTPGIAGGWNPELFIPFALGDQAF